MLPLHQTRIYLVTEAIITDPEGDVKVLERGTTLFVPPLFGQKGVFSGDGIRSQLGFEAARICYGRRKDI
jgi:hypothetical protein